MAASSPASSSTIEAVLWMLAGQVSDGGNGSDEGEREVERKKKIVYHICLIP